VKNNIHPAYGYVVFRDRGADYQFLTRSTATSDKTIEWADGRTYPVVDVQISAGSHPFWTGRNRLIDSAGRVEKFRAKYATARASRCFRVSGRAAPPRGLRSPACDRARC
jgi:large subunit ribosomal protein L31